MNLLVQNSTPKNIITTKRQDNLKKSHPAIQIQKIRPNLV